MITTKKATVAKAKVSPEVREEKSTRPSTIMDVWSKSEKDRNSDELSMNFKLLRADAEGQMLKYQKQVLEAESKLNKVLSESCKNPNFKAISEARLDVEAAVLQESRAVDTYVSLFGTTPAIAN